MIIFNLSFTPTSWKAPYMKLDSLTRTVNGTSPTSDAACLPKNHMGPTTWQCLHVSTLPLNLTRMVSKLWWCPCATEGSVTLLIWSMCFGAMLAMGRCWCY